MKIDKLANNLTNDSIINAATPSIRYRHSREELLNIFKRTQSFPAPQLLDEFPNLRLPPVLSWNNKQIMEFQLTFDDTTRDPLPVLPVGENLVDIIEYLFSDEYVKKDTFIRGRIATNPNRWVTITNLLRYSRVSAISTNIGDIAEAVSRSTGRTIEVHGDRTKIRRISIEKEIEMLGENNEWRIEGNDNM